MELSHLKYFYEVARQGSFSKAAKTLRVSQPSISKMVKQLEHREGYTFLDRERKGVRLTPLGRLLYERCERIFNEYDDLKRSLEVRKDECRGELWLGASDNLCNYVLPEILSDFLKKSPGVQVKLFSGVASSIASQLKDFHLEVGLFYTFVKDRFLLLEEIRRVEFVIVVSQKVVGGKRPLLKDIHGLSYIGSRVADYAKPYPALQMLKSAGITPKKVIETNQQETQKRLVEAGLGYSMLPIHMVRGELATGTLVRLKTPDRLESPLYLAIRRNRTLSNVALRWREAILASPV